MKRKRFLLGILAGALLACAVLWQVPLRVRHLFAAMPPLVPKTQTAARILAGAKAQLGTRYDASYQVISYPNGDVPLTQGACTDVVVRALRHAGFDLQKLMHEDMMRDFSSYPQAWHLPAPDANIDHRRVPNQMRFFQKFGRALMTDVAARDLTQWQPGDVVYWNAGRNLHTGIVSDTRNERGAPLVIHNGWKCIEDDALTRWPIIGHFRFPSENLR